MRLAARLATMNGTANRFSLSGRNVGTAANLNVRGWRQKFTGMALNRNSSEYSGTVRAGGLADSMEMPVQ